MQSFSKEDVYQVVRKTSSSLLRYEEVCIPRSLNTDDNKLSLGPDESKFSLNIDAEGFGEDEAGVVKHVRGNSSASFSDESIQLQ